MKKILSSFLLILVPLVFFNIKTYGYYLQPENAIKINSLNSVPNYLGQFGTAELIQRDMINSNVYADDYLFVFKASKKASISYYDFTEMLSFSESTVGSSVTYTKAYRETTTYTYEQMIANSKCISTSYKLETEIGLDKLNFKGSQESTFETSLTEEVRKSTSKSLDSSTSFEYEFKINKPGYYMLQNRALYNVYSIIKVTEVYDVQTIGGKPRRIASSPTKTYVLERYLKFTYNTDDSLGMYKYIRDDYGNFTIDTSDLLDNNIVVYL